MVTNLYAQLTNIDGMLRDMLILCVAVWYVIGLGMTLNEMRHDMDVTVERFLTAFIIAIAGPFMLCLTVYRYSNTVIIKKKQEI